MSVGYPTIQAVNQDFLLKVAKLEMSADSLAAAASLSVLSVVGIGVGDYLLIGDFGQETSEIVRVSTGVAPSAGTITLNANAVFAHPRGTPVYRIDRNEIEFSRATTLAGSKSVLATVAIQCDQLTTNYEDTTNTTGFGFYRAKNSADSTFSNYSESYPYAGYGQQSVKVILDSALTMLGFIDALGQPYFPSSLSRQVGIIAINDCQQELKEMKHRWSYLTDFGYAIGEIATGQDTYDLPSDIAEGEGNVSVYDARVGSKPNMKFLFRDKFMERRWNVNKTTLGAAITSTGDLTVTLTDSSDFGATGSIYVVDDDGLGFDTIDYTSNDKTTNILSGVTNITETHLADAVVWQSANFGMPTRYTIFEGKIVLDPIPSADYAGLNLYLDCYLKAEVTNDLADEAQFPATVIKPYVAYRFALIAKEAMAGAMKADYMTEKDKITRKEDTGQAKGFKPNRLPDVTSNFGLRGRSPSDNE